jgi:hypothetical protein
MNPDSARSRRSVLSKLLGALAMSGSLAIVGVLVTADVAAANEPAPAAEVQQVQQQPDQVSESEAAVSYMVPDEPKAEAPEKAAPQKRVKKKRAKVDFGRFEGY